MIKVQVMQHGQNERAESQHGGVGVGFSQSHRIGGVIVFKIINNFPQKYGLDYSDALLKGKEGGALIRNASHTSFS